MALTHFLLVYDLKEQRLISEQPYKDAAAAASAYAECELEYRGNRDVEIVLVGADSIETIRLTHGNYFDGSPSASPFLAGV